MLNLPNGGKLINRSINKSELDFKSVDLELELDRDQVNDVRNISVGLYSPLEGFVNEDDYKSILESKSLRNGVTWSIPIILPVKKSAYDKVKIGSLVILKENGKELASLTVESKYKLDKKEYNENIYGTNDTEHPGVKMVNNYEDYVLGGEVWVYGKYHSIYPEFDKTPAEVRNVFESNDWDTIVGFQTRNPAHKAHEHIQRICMEFVDGLFINPIIGKKKTGDFKDEVILAVYKMLVERFYPQKSTLLAVFNSRMNYAGPKEAVHHAIIRKNYGCSHFIVGRDHAGVGNYYDTFAAHKIFDEVDLGMQVMKVSNAFYDRRLNMFATQKTSPFSEVYRVSPSGTQVREHIKGRNYEALRQVMRDEVLDVIFSFELPFVE